MHRIGRTGRAGKSGKAISLVAGREFGRLQQVNRFTKTQMTRITVPKMEDLENKHATRLVDTVRSTLESRDYKPQDAIVDDLLQSGNTPSEVISALLHLLAAEVVRPVERIKEDMAQRDTARPPRRSFEAAPGGDEPRAERYERPQRGERPPSSIDANGTWLRINIGKNAGVLPKDVVGCLAGESGLDASVIGQIQILPTITLVQVAADHSEHILTAINGARMCGRNIGASVGSAPRPMGDRPGGGGGGGGYGPPPRREGGGYGPPRREGSYGGPRREGGGGYGAGPRYGGKGGGYRGNRD